MHCPRLRYEFHEKFRSCIWSYCWFFFLSYRYLNISLSFFSSLIFALPCLLLNNIFACHFEHFCTVIFSFSLSYSLITFYCRTPCYITLTPYNSLTPHHTTPHSYSPPPIPSLTLPPSHRQPCHGAQSHPIHGQINSSYGPVSQMGCGTHFNEN